MKRSDMDRRAFLEKFVALSSASLVLVGCGGSEGSVYGPPPADNDENAIAVYGPPPVDVDILPTVIGIYYKDNENNLQPLHDKTDLPLNLTIEILFSKDMDSDSKSGIHLTHDDNNISFESRWKTEDRVEIILSDSVIEYDTQYTIYIGDVMDKEGNGIDYTQGNFTAIFRTKQIEEES